MREHNTRFTKVIAVVLSVALVLGMLPNAFVTAFAAEGQQMGTLSAITDGGKVTEASGEAATVTYGEEAVTLSWSKANPTVGRTTDGWWLGIQMTAPANMTKEEHFTDVYYQTGVGEGWSVNKSFWNAQDSDKTVEDTERYITLWGMVNEEYLNTALVNGKTIEYKWQFDWDADGSFEQKAILTIDPAKVELTKDGSVVYPVAEANGQVAAISEGLTVQESNSSHIVNVLHETEQTLAWCAANASIGRNNDGWWAGIKIIAPANLTESQLESAKYERLIYGASDWSSELSFWNNKDSKAGATSHYIEMWMYLTPDILAEATEAGENVTNQYRFDWNGDGVCEQSVIFEINPEKVILDDADSKQVYPELGTVTPITNGTVSGVTGNKVVTVEEVTLSWSAANNAIGRTTDGWWAGIKVTAPADLAESELEGSKYQRLTHGQTEWVSNLSFWKNKDSKAGDVSHHIELWMCLTPAILKEATDAGQNVTNQYQFDWDGDGAYEQTITFIVVPSDKIVLVKENQTAIEFDNVPSTFVYSETPYQINVIGGDGEGQLSYQITDNTDVASVNANGVLTLHKAGTFTLKVVKAGDDTYNDGIAITKTITVEPAEQTGFEFKDKKPANITYNDNSNKYTNKALGGQSVGAVTYEITSGSDVADISKTTGELTIKKAGVVTVTATKAADDKYKVATAEYTITIDKAEQDIAFANGSKVDVTYGALTYSNIAKEVGALYGTKAITYEVTSGNDIASVDSTGIVTFVDKKVGTVTIKATKAEDDCYNECTAIYTLEVQYLETPENAYTLKGETKNKSGWYTGDVTIKAPEGYEISCSNAITGNTWSDSVLYEKEGTNSPVVYLRDTNGGITNAITIQDIKIDKTAPTGLKIEYTQSTIKKIIEKLSFGIYTAPVEVTISAADDVSGIAKLKYTYKNAGEEFPVEKVELESNESYTFNIDPQFRDTITFTAEDVAGNTIDKVDMEVDENGKETGRENVIVVDTEKPVIEPDYEWVSTLGYKEAENGYFYTQDGVTLKWNIVESNYDLADAPVVTVNGDTVDASWTSEGKGEYTLSEEGKYVVQVSFTDKAGFTDIYEKTIIIDKTAPVISVDPNIEKTSDTDETVYYNDSKEFTITIKEENFNFDDLIVEFTSSNALEGQNVKEYKAFIETESNWDHDGDTHTITVLFEEDANYQLALKYSDLSGREDQYTCKEFVVDHKAPIITVTPDIEKTAELSEKVYYNGSKTFTIRIDEHNFDLAKVVPSIVASNVLSGVTVSDYEAYITNAGNWSHDGDIHEITVTFAEDANYQMILSFTDLAGYAEQYVSREFVIDNVDSEINVVIAQEQDKAENGKYYNVKRTATITIEEHNFDAKDVVIDVSVTRKLDEAVVIADYQEILTNPNSWTSKGDVHTATITFSEDADYQWTLDYTDLSGRSAEQYVSEEYVIDNVNPEINVEIKPDAPSNGKYYSETRVATITITEHNLDAKDIVVNVTASNKLDEAAVIEDYQATLTNPANWTHEGDVHTATIEFKVDADYKWTLDYTDLSGRKAVQYVSEEYVIDNENPEINVEIKPNAPSNGKYYSEARVATITITEHNFDAKDIVVNVTASNKLDEAAVIEDYQAPLTNPANWTHEGDVHTATIEFKVDADYKWTLDYTDLSGRKAVQYVSEEYVIDNVDPVISVQIEPVLEDSIYYNVKRTATITITEHNFDVKDIVIDVNATRKLDETAVIEDYQATLTDPDSWTSVGDVHTATIEFKVDADYQWTLDYTDLASRKAVQYVSETFVIDNVDPVIKVDITPKAEEASNEKYHSVKRTAEITITEHNFTASGIMIDVDVTRQLAGTEEVEDYQATLTNPDNWTSDGDVHKAIIEFTVDADYKWTLDCTDLAKRQAKQYMSEEFVIDNVDPELVSVEYTNKEAVFTDKEDGREYVDIEDGEAVTATITIDEHNFDAKYVDVIVTAKDVAGKDVLLDDSEETLEAYYSAYFKNPEVWESEGDVHKATIVYDQDANFTFDINFVDLANRSINATVNRAADLFTIDRVAPTNLKATYSDGVFDTNVDGKDYEYYADQMTVTISGEDEISGIQKFVYSYLNDIGVSAVNASGSGEIKVENIEQNGYTFTTTFTIPKEALSANNQFNGTIEFTAHDVIDNSTKQVEQKRIVVDNIAPTAQITYNDPVKNANGISYYAGDITGTIVINEANFYSEDVQMVVTRDGNAVPVAITWVDNSVDQHTGTFTLHDDGDYIVTINYADRSTNKISTYTSNELTVDTVQPSVSVSNIKINTANKDETYGFTIIANDINFDSTTFKPVLTAVVRGEDGSYTTKTIPLGNMTTVQEGQTYTYTIKNLEEDGIYTLTCAVKDMSDNAYANIRLDDGREYETVQFSINRDGSTFAIGDYTDDVINKYYIYSVDKDIVLVEINADPITNYNVMVNGRVLESDEYTTTMTGGNGEWYKRTYTIPKALFEAEGEYNIVVRSTDKAQTEAYSDVKNIKVAFVVDQTAPVLTISGLAAEGRYQTEEQTVTVIPTDDGGRLYNFKAVVFDNDGNPLKDEKGNDISVRFEMEGEELLKYLEEHDGKITFTVPEGYQNNVQIICTDCAMNSEGTTNAFDETYVKVTVSPNQLIIFYANKPLFYGTIIGILAIISGIIFFIAYKKRKKEEEEVK